MSKNQTKKQTKPKTKTIKGKPISQKKTKEKETRTSFSRQERKWRVVPMNTPKDTPGLEEITLKDAILLPRYNEGLNPQGYTKEEAILWILAHKYKANFKEAKRVGPFPTKHYWSFKQRLIYESVRPLGERRISPHPDNPAVLRRYFAYRRIPFVSKSSKKHKRTNKNKKKETKK